MGSTTSRRWALAERPAGIPDGNTFKLEETPLPALEDGQVRVRVTHFSLDPGMRPALSRDTYVGATPIGSLITSAGVGVVEESRSDRLKEGDFVSGGFGWQSALVARDKHCVKHDPRLFNGNVTPTAAIGILGIPGMTSWFGLKEIGQLAEGETVLISSASGPVGATAGQLARLMGAGRVVGIAGSKAKCDWLTAEAGFDACLNYREADDLEAAMREACDGGADIYFDNVGGEMLDAAINVLKPGGRIAVSGQLSEYNREEPHGIRNTLPFITQRLTMRGFVVLDFVREFGTAAMQMVEWINDGKLIYREEIIDGIENAPEAYAGLFKGDNFGRRLIKVS
ncbi:NADP-dependent oxidoreductase [Pyruvatibacter mobilis]|uniref:NADP-dependent oxidoreductase n=1 Tax=Pyruvatibacter mobilis TaxID=1712261 RepID=UPI003D100883